MLLFRQFYCCGTSSLGADMVKEMMAKVEIISPKRYMTMAREISNVSLLGSVCKKKRH